MVRKISILVLIMALVIGCFTFGYTEDEPVTITWYGVGTQSDHQARVNNAISAYLQANGLNVKLDYIDLSWGDFLQNYQVIISSQEEFDILNARGNILMGYAKNGALTEITDEMIEEYIPGVRDVVKKDLLDAFRIDGKLYMLPAMHEKAQYYGLTVYNAGIAEALELDMSSIHGFDDLDEIFEKVHEAYPDIICVADENSLMLTAYCNYVFINSTPALCIGLDVMEENAQIRNIFEVDEAINMLYKLSDWYKKGYMCRDLSVDMNAVSNEGRIFCRIGGYKPGCAAEYTRNEVTYYDMAFDPDRQAVTSLFDVPTSWSHAISKTSKHPELAAQVLNYAYSDVKFINLLVYGEEGIDYYFDDEGFLNYIDGGFANDCAGDRSWQIANVYNNYVTRNYADMGLADVWEVQKAFNDNALVTESTGFYFDTTDVEIEVAALANVYDQYGVLLWKGMAEDVDATLAEFNQKLYDNGLQRVLDAANEQYQAFLDSKN